MCACIVHAHPDTRLKTSCLKSSAADQTKPLSSFSTSSSHFSHLYGVLGREQHPLCTPWCSSDTQTLLQPCLVIVPFVPPLATSEVS